MFRFKCKAPDGAWMYTVAPSLRKARMNFEWRLRREGMFYAHARSWAADTEPA